MLRGFGRLLQAGLALAALAMPAHAFGGDPYCLSPSYGNEPARLAPLRFGIDPELAGSVGTGQPAAVARRVEGHGRAACSHAARQANGAAGEPPVLVGRRSGDRA